MANAANADAMKIRLQVIENRHLRRNRRKSAVCQGKAPIKHTTVTFPCCIVLVKLFAFLFGLLFLQILGNSFVRLYKFLLQIIVVMRQRNSRIDNRNIQQSRFGYNFSRFFGFFKKKKSFICNCSLLSLKNTSIWSNFFRCLATNFVNSCASGISLCICANTCSLSTNFWRS